MDALLMVLVAAALLVISFFSYGRWLSKRVFSLRADSTTPAVSLRDDRDYVPTKKSIVFGHHFTSIAGTGPIVGPAIAVMWGWLPAILWVVLGAIFIGAVHDLGSLVVSLKNKGRTVGDIAGDLLGPRVRTLFLTILIVALWIVLAIFGLVIAAVLKQYPGAILPVLVQIPLALAIGLFIHRAGKSILLPSLIALAIMFASVIWGDTGFLHTFNEVAAAQPTWMWVLALLAYAYIASVLPVWTLLQPRDYINALQLVSALALLVAGLVGAAFLGGEPIAEGADRVPLELVAPVINTNPDGAPPMIPVLFITIACGAISGFHCLVSSGTTSKQLAREPDAHTVGYGSMLTESFLATLVIAACAAGIGLGITTKLFQAHAAGSGHNYASTQYVLPLNEDEVVGILEEQWGDPVSNRISTRWQVWKASSANLRQIGIGQDSHIVPLENHPSGTQFANAGGSDSFVATLDQHGFFSLGPFSRYIKIPAGQVFWSSDDRVRGDWSQRFTTTGELAFHNKYESWSAAGSLGAKVSAFVDGAANLIAAIGVPRNIALALMGVLVASFAGTTMDTACRLQRYVIQELARSFLPKRDGSHCLNCNYNLAGLPESAVCPECATPLPSPRGRGAGGEGARTTKVETPTSDIDEQSLPLPNPLPLGEGAGWRTPFRLLATTHGATAFAVITAALLAFMPAPGQPWALSSAGSGGLLLWPLFGATNQLLAGLAFIVIAAWLIKNRRPWWFIIPPAILMLVFPAWALALQAYIGDTNMVAWAHSGQWLLVTISTVMLAIEVWMILELAHRLRSGKLGPPSQPVDVKTADQGSEFSTGG